jgi:putative nucleotidyltransferase with HDIG domain
MMSDQTISFASEGPARAYALITAVIASVATLLAYPGGISWSPDPTDLVLLCLYALGRWIRMGVEPSGHVTLGPLILFISVLTGHVHIALLSAALIPILVTRHISRRKWNEAIAESGEEALASALFVAVMASVRLSIDIKTLVIYVIAVIGYVLVKLAVDGGFALLSAGVRFSSSLATGATYIFAHHVVLAVAALVVSLLYSQVGFLVVPLAAIALIEFYYPGKLISEQREVSFASLSMIAQAIDAKDPYTAMHSRNVSEIAVRIARRMRLPENEVRKLRIGGLLHDIGKIGVSAQIIRKPGELTSGEQLAMREHPVVSANIMKPVELLTEAAEFVRHHHEYYDGSGYPDGLVGTEIPLGSRIILVADAYDALTTDRPYRKGRSTEEALTVLREHAGRQFDAQIVAAFEEVLQSL